MASMTSDSTTKPIGSDDSQQSYSFSTEKVVLSVGDRKFTTNVGTLVDRSDFFAALFSGRWTVQKQEDGSIFVDADPCIFAYILSYLRRGVFPLAFDEKTGEHDVRLYMNLLAEAKYFQVRMLEVWLEDELYLKCVAHTSQWKPLLGDRSLGERSWSSSPGVQLVNEGTTVTHSWVCPEMLKELPTGRATYYHQHHRCSSIPDKQGALDRHESTQWAEYTTKLTFKKGWCIDEG